MTPVLHVSTEPLTYDGTQLAPHWIHGQFGIQGDAAVAFVGSADVKVESMVDCVDARQGLFIASDEMLHIIVESFGPDLDRAVLLQRLLVMLLFEQLVGAGVAGVSRVGDDIFVGDGKLTVSIATISTVSCLVHLGINVATSGAPVKVSGLSQCGVSSPHEFAHTLLKAFSEDLEGMRMASTKVRGV